MPQDIIDARLVGKLLQYEAQSGKLFWLSRDREYFSCNGSYLRFNKTFAGKEAFTATDARGYKSGRIFNKTYHGHRVAWACHFAEWPDVIDHINGNRSDNRLENLRNVTKAQNALRKAQKNNLAGVSFCNRRKLWRARVTFQYKETHIGYFQTEQEAINARKQVNEKLGFTYY